MYLYCKFSSMMNTRLRHKTMFVLGSQPAWRSPKRNTMVFVIAYTDSDGPFRKCLLIIVCELL